MGRRLFVGNLSFATTDDDLREAFAGLGSVVNSKVISDRETGRSRGFGFVEFSSEDEAAGAIETLNGTQLGGRTINVNEAQERPQRRDGGSPPPRDDRQGGDDRKKNTRRKARRRTYESGSDSW